MENGNKFQQYFGLTVFFIINAINFADRLSITTVLDDIKKYYGIDAGPAGWLAPSFLVGYMFTAPLFGYLGDRYPRKHILIGGITFWCASCASAYFFNNNHYKLFMLSRALVGVGEASYSTIAPTLIADLFPPQKRKMALSIFYFAIPFGTGFGYWLGQIALKSGDWRLLFQMTPTIGCITIILLFFLEEPPRGKSDAAAVAGAADQSTILDNTRYLLNIRSYVWSTLGFTCCIFTMGVLSWSAIEFMKTAQGEDYKADASTIFGIIVIVAGLVGISSGSFLAQYMRPYDGRADALVCALSVLLGVPTSFFGLILAKSHLVLSWLFLFAAVLSLSANWAVISDMTLSVTLPQKRAFASAGQILVSHLLGDAISPVIAGYLHDYLNTVYPDDNFTAFLYALLPSLIVLALGVPAFLYSAKFYVQDMETCKQEMSKGMTEINETLRSEEANLTDFAAVP